MTALRDRIAAAIKRADEAVYEDGADPFLRFRPASYDDLANAVIAELTTYLPPIFASAIHAYADSEIAAMRYHGASKDAFYALEKLNGEAAQIANYATTHEKWNGRADDDE